MKNKLLIINVILTVAILIVAVAQVYFGSKIENYSTPYPDPENLKIFLDNFERNEIPMSKAQTLELINGYWTHLQNAAAVYQEAKPAFIEIGIVFVIIALIQFALAGYILIRFRIEPKSKP
jgi:hypothetical protein